MLCSDKHYLERSPPRPGMRPVYLRQADLQPLLVLTVTVYVCVPDATGVAVVLLVVEAVTPLPDQL